MPNKSRKRRSGSREHHGSEPGTPLIIETVKRSPNPRRHQQQQIPIASPKNRGTGNEQRDSETTGIIARKQQSSTEILLKMSDACCKHGDYHSKKQPNCRPDPNNDEANLPQRCLKDIRALRQLLPKVEKTIQPQVDSNEASPRAAKTGRSKAIQKEGTEASDICHLCDFYESVLNGVFCPHAPHLFQWGKGGIDVLPRVLYLYKHLTTTPIIANSMKLPTGLHQQGTNQRATTAADKICITIAQLLSFIPDESLYPCIVYDLIHLLVDLSIVVEEGLLTHNQHRSIEVDFLSDTIKACQLRDASDFVLNLTSSSVVSSLQEATFSVLRDFLKYLHKQRIEPLQHRAPAPLSRIRPGNLDLFFYGVLEDGVTLPLLLAALRQVLQSPHYEWDNAVLSLRSKVAASRLLIQLVQDWHNDNIPIPSTIVEVAMLVARSVKALLFEYSQLDFSDEKIVELSKEFYMLLTSLVHDAILVPPRVSGFNSRRDSLWMIRSPTFSTFLDCLVLIADIESDDANDATCEVKDANDFLSTIVLRTIHAFRCTRHWQHSAAEHMSSESILWNYCNSHRITDRLFPILKNSKLSEHVVGLLAFLLDPLYRYTNSADLTTARLEDLNNICLKVFEMHNSEQNPMLIRGNEFKAPAESTRTTTTNPCSDKYEFQEDDVKSTKEKGSKAVALKRKVGSLVSSQQILELDDSPSKKRRLSRHHQEMSKNPRVDNAGKSRPTTNFENILVDSFEDFLVTALRASKRLCQPFQDSSNSELDASAGSTDVTMTLNGVRLLLSMLERRVAMCRKIVYEDLKPTLDIICIYAGALASRCDKLDTLLAKGESESFSHFTRVLLDASITCGLHAQFTVEIFLRQFTLYRSSAYRALFDTFSRMGARLGMVKLPQGCPQSHNPGEIPGLQPSCSLCGGLNSVFPVLTDTGDPNRLENFSSPFCPCYIGVLDEPAENDAEFSVESDWAISAINALPLRTRCLLLAALRNEDHEIQEVRLRPDSVRNSLSALFGSDGPPVSHDCDQFAMAHAVMLSPLRLQSLSCRNDMTSIDTSRSRATPGELLCTLLQDFTTNLLGPASVTLSETCKTAVGATAFLLAFDRLSWLLKTLGSGASCLEDKGSVKFSARGVLDYFSGISCTSDHDTIAFTETIQRKQLAIDESLRVIQSSCIEDYEWCSSVPSVRLLTWKCVTAMYLKCPRKNLREQVGRMRKGTNTEPMVENDANRDGFIHWIILAAFSDPDIHVREYASKEIGRILLSDSCSILFAIFSTLEEWKKFNDSLLRSNHHFTDLSSPSSLNEESDVLTSRFFHQLDRLLYDISCFSESQLSLSIARPGDSNENSQDGAKKPLGDCALLQRSALRVLSSLCSCADIEEHHGRALYEKALLRLGRVWASPQVIRHSSCFFPYTPSTCSGRAIAFSELARISQLRPIGHVSDQKFTERLASSIFYDILIPGSDANRERQYRLLEIFICSFVTPTANHSWVYNWRLAVIDALTFVEETLPAIVAQFVAEKDYTLLCLTTCFREFLVDRKSTLAKTEGGTGYLVGLPNASARRRCRALQSSREDLEKKTKNLCLEPGLIDRILPLIFMNSDRSGLVFFTRDVLKGMTLHKIVTLREQMILKGFVWELGRDPNLAGQAMRAIRTAAIARIQEPVGSKGGNPADHGSLADEPAGRKDISAACQWITKNFMYLLVNVIQHKWKSRSLLERVHAIRCLNGMLDFLLPVESSQYFPQILATVNASIDQDVSASDIDSNVATLQLLAVEAMSKFVRLVNQWEAIAPNLTSIVVSLVPVIESQDVDIPEQDRITRKSREVAVNLLEYLTSGRLGKMLAKKMVEIPFLPLSSSLDTVRQSLRSNGVDFDDHLLLSGVTQDAQVERRDNWTGQECSVGSKTSSTTFTASEKIVALQKRLRMVCMLLDNENSSVRQVVLKHITELLRANRELFQGLVEREGTTSMKRYLTVDYRDSDSSAGSSGCNEGLTSVTYMIEKLLARCVHEVDSESRTLLGTCIGEVGAISEHLLGEIRVSDGTGANPLDGGGSSHAWRLNQPPWQSQVAKYELRLVTKLLVVSLRAAPTSADQHKIAFTIQQLLILLDNSTRRDGGGQKGDGSERAEMSKWLHDKLCESGVFEIIEPFWLSEFSEKADSIGRGKKPPYFHSSSSYFLWISNFCRFMETSSRTCSLSRWSELFFACRTSVRTHAGLNITEFIFPLLILDRLCFGSKQDEETIRKEIIDVLNFDSDKKVHMTHTERQKAVNAVFTVLDTLCFWAECETERRHRSSRSTSKSNSEKRGQTLVDATIGTNSWPADEALSRIDDVLWTIDLSLQAKAAACVGMHARSLRLLEMGARRQLADQIFNTNLNDSEKSKRPQEEKKGEETNNDADVELLKDVLFSLDDAETLSAVGEKYSSSDDPKVQVRDSIRQKEASGHYEAALQDYERALQLRSEDSRDPTMERGLLQCLLQLGQFESVLNQVTGLVHRRLPNTGATVYSPGAAHIVPLAVEAAWRLGRWHVLSDLVRQEELSDAHKTSDDEGKYQIAIGAAMLGLHKKDSSLVGNALKDARQALMQSLSTTARESYSRSYSLIVRLHSLREIENASESLCKRGSAGSATISDVCQSNEHDGWGWDGRLSYVSAQGATEIINIRLALARLAEEPNLEGVLFLKLGKQARKSGLYTIAANHFSQSESKFTQKKMSDIISCLDDVKMQFAKLKHATGEGTTALRLLGHDSMQKAFDQMIVDRDDVDKIIGIATSHEMQRIGSLSLPSSVSTDGDKVIVERFAGRLLQITQWMADGGLKSGAEIIERYRFVHKLASKWEKGHFKFAKYVESFMKSRLNVLARKVPGMVGLGSDEDQIRSNIICVDEPSQKYILAAVRHYAEALTLDSKHVYQALPRLLSLWFEFTSIQKGAASEPNSKDPLATYQQEVNSCLASHLKRIPATSFYTALPQLISRIIHDDKNTALVVQEILKRVLTKFPAQAMWPLAWLKGSRNAARAKIGDLIFRGAADSYGEGHRMQSLLRASTSLFTFLQSLATFQGDEPLTSSISIEPWKGSVELSEFIPPLQAALSVSTLSSSSNGSKDFFPRTIPRMRAFSTRVGVMSSKAKPKRLKAFAVPGTLKSFPRTNAQQGANPLKCDIGEIHFLVKQEAKGDLRKDARVQDLNNVINRLMASSSKSSGYSTGRRRRLQLRTFAVTCLSENVGVIEWCSNTDSMRRLVTQSYNPQASPYSIRRRGARVADFANTGLRSQFDKCQNIYFKNGNLSRAAVMFAELCVKPNPPLLYWWFVNQFHDPHAWYETRTRFAVSAAVWSAVGHVIGLGDRHSENILIDTTNGDCVHVDFDCIFDKGLDLPKPEIVPFRLTQNMQDAFGPTGPDGVFSSGLQTAMRTLRGNRDTLLSVLEPFLKDPIIDWKRNRSQQKKSKGSSSSSHQRRESEETAAKRSINVIDERLNGIYNFKNPNSRKIRRTDGMSTSEDELSQNVLPLSVEGQVHKMIAEAMSHENLVQLYVGWMPWL